LGKDFCASANQQQPATDVKEVNYLIKYRLEHWNWTTDLQSIKFYSKHTLVIIAKNVLQIRCEERAIN